MVAVSNGQRMTFVALSTLPALQMYEKKLYDALFGFVNNVKASVSQDYS
jgi:hypothetical protein